MSIRLILSFYEAFCQMLGSPGSSHLLWHGRQLVLLEGVVKDAGLFVCFKLAIHELGKFFQSTVQLVEILNIEGTEALAHHVFARGNNGLAEMVACVSEYNTGVAPVTGLPPFAYSQARFF